MILLPGQGGNGLLLVRVTVGDYTTLTARKYKDRLVFRVHTPKLLTFPPPAGWMVSGLQQQRIVRLVGDTMLRGPMPRG